MVHSCDRRLAIGMFIFEQSCYVKSENDNIESNELM